MKKRWLWGILTGLVVLGLTIPAAAKDPFQWKPKHPKPTPPARGKRAKVPEPATFGLVGAGLASLGLLRREIRHKK